MPTLEGAKARGYPPEGFVNLTNSLELLNLPQHAAGATRGMHERAFKQDC